MGFASLKSPTAEARNGGGFLTPSLRAVGVVPARWLAPTIQQSTKTISHKRYRRFLSIDQ